MKYLIFTFIIITAICLVGCASSNMINNLSPTHTLLTTRTGLPPTRTPANTRTPLPTPTQTQSPTATQIPIPPPEGLIFQGDKGNTLWITQSSGTNLLLFEGPENSYSWPSGDLKKVTYIQNPPSGEFRGVPKEQFLVDLVSGKTQQIWPVPDKNLCTFSFVGNDSKAMINNLMHPERDLGYDCSPGSPVIATLNGANISKLKILDENLSSRGRSSISPDEKFLAFDIDGNPQFYKINGLTYPHEVEKYGFTELEKPEFYGPSWSPSGRYIAWDVVSKSDSEIELGIVIFDLDEKTSVFSPDHEVRWWEVWYGLIFWSADENYLAIIHPETDYFALINRKGETLVKFEEMENLDDFEWSPAGHYYAISRYINKEPIITIEAPDSSEAITVGSGRITTWSPNGDALIFKRDDQYWLYDMQTKTSNPIALPEGVHLIEWHDMNTTTTP